MKLSPLLYLSGGDNLNVNLGVSCTLVLGLSVCTIVDSLISSKDISDNCNYFTDAILYK